MNYRKFDFDPPDAVNKDDVGSFPARTKAGGGYVWDAVLEYRVWVHNSEGDHFSAFATFRDALRYSEDTPGAKEPLALILQEEFISEPEPGNYVHIKERRLTEWPVEFLKRPCRTSNTIPDFLSPDAPDNRLDILRGEV